jgi:hypothetical protein
MLLSQDIGSWTIIRNKRLKCLSRKTTILEAKQIKGANPMKTVYNSLIVSTSTDHEAGRLADQISKEIETNNNKKYETKKTKDKGTVTARKMCAKSIKKKELKRAWRRKGAPKYRKKSKTNRTKRKKYFKNRIVENGKLIKLAEVQKSLAGNQPAMSIGEAALQPPSTNRVLERGCPGPHTSSQLISVGLIYLLPSSINWYISVGESTKQNKWWPENR